MGNLYRESKGLATTHYTDFPLRIACLKPGDVVLDVGCGRGEIVFQTAEQGAVSTGIDFAESAIALASETRLGHEGRIRDNTRFLVGNALDLPFDDRQFDKVFMLDIVEHLSREELLASFAEVGRVLKDDGILVIHSTQNIWTRKYGYWLAYAACVLLRKERPTHSMVAQFRALEDNPEHDPRSVLLHINEQSVLSLKIALARSGYRSVVWLARPRNPFSGKTDKISRLLDGLYRHLGLKFVNGNNIYAVGSRSREAIPGDLPRRFLMSP